jgi:hypothetical protein
LHGALSFPSASLSPKIRRHGRLEDATWDEALTLVADKFREAQPLFLLALTIARMCSAAADDGSLARQRSLVGRDDERMVEGISWRSGSPARSASKTSCVRCVRFPLPPAY